MNQQHIVTIGVASYNNAKYVCKTLDSIKGQTYPFIELVIVDDCSTDNSVEVIKNWLDKNTVTCTFIINDKNQGIPKVCNLLLKHMKGKYHQLIASDDYMHPEKIEKQVAHLEHAGDNVAVVYSDAFVVNENDEVVNESLWNFFGHNPEKMPEGSIFMELLITNFIPALSVLIRNDCIRKIGLYDETLIFEDLDMWLRITQQYKIVCLKEKTCYYRVHSASMLQNKKSKVRFFESQLKCYSKYLGINNEYDQIIQQHIIQKAVEIYSLGGRESSIWLYKSFLAKKSGKTLLLFLLSLVDLNIFEWKRKFLNYNKN